MTAPRASNPSTAAASAPGAKANPSKSGSSNSSGSGSSYAERNRTEDPAPADDEKNQNKVALSECQILSDSSELAGEKKFRASCDVQWTGDDAPTSLRLAIKIQMRWEESAGPKEEEALKELTGYMDAASNEQTVAIEDTLPRRPSFPPDGTKIAHKLVASHPEAESTAESTKVEITLKEAVHYAEVPDILFTHGWSCDPGTVDDADGPKTQAAVKSFQVRFNDKYKLDPKPDGVAGPKTWKAVHRVVCGLVAERTGDPHYHPAVHDVEEIQVNGSGADSVSFAEGQEVVLEDYLSHGHSPFHNLPIQMALVRISSDAGGAPNA
jgi:peptidoglycan hydrolase-like protein with peptidoglycan-binding domain